MEPVGLGYVISLGLDNLSDKLDWKGYCLTLDTSSLQLYFTDPINSCLVWDVSTNESGKGILFGTKRDDGSY